ncbi:hypothetical protein GGR77_004223 [Xanthomonas translucens]
MAFAHCEGAGLFGIAAAHGGVRDAEMEKPESAIRAFRSFEAVATAEGAAECPSIRLGSAAMP